MKRGDRTTRLVFAAFVAIAMACWATAMGPFQSALAQVPLGFPAPPTSSQFELDGEIDLPRASSTTLAHLERVKAQLLDRQWNEAIATLRRVMESSGDELIGITERRFISLRDYAHIQLAALPAEALGLYRQQVDPMARQWLRRGLADRDPTVLRNIVEQAFASRSGDDALTALGEIALESGDHAGARWYWERILPVDYPEGVRPTWPGYPDTDLDPAAIRARLVLVSILEGSGERARSELDEFIQLHGDVRGRMGGRDVVLADALSSLLDESRAWPADALSRDWPTFAGSAARNAIAAQSDTSPVDFAAVAWRIPLSEVPDVDAPLSFHPAVTAGLVLVNNEREIMAINSSSGEPAWGGRTSTVYRDPSPELMSHGPAMVGARQRSHYTLTTYDGRLFARMGVAPGRRPRQGAVRRELSVAEAGRLICLDLDAEGRLLWETTPEPGWAFEGSPIVDDRGVYVVMRELGARRRVHIACFDVSSGDRRWLRFICGAEMPADGLLSLADNLLTLQAETLFLNTNLGAVAAVSTRDGRIRWLSLYPRTKGGDLREPAPHWKRALTPCLYDRGTLFVAPADSPLILAFDAATGQILWKTDEAVEDVVHLLGTTPNHLIASGGRLYWISLNRENAGRIEYFRPESEERPGHGRGLLVGDQVVWPTRDRILLLEQKTAEVRKTIELRPRGACGGNLLLAGKNLLVATGTELLCLGHYADGETEEAILSRSTIRDSAVVFPRATSTIHD